MTAINEALQQRFQEKFPGTTVNLAAGGTDEALKALLKGEVDLVAVGRPLTDQEKAQGLVEVPVSREKIAIIISPNNSFNGSLTFDQFAKMFRGEITDWSQVGGTPGAIRFVDRPNFSDTRQALSSYTVFQSAPFQTGANATQVAQDDTATVVRTLGDGGISYAIASQVLNQGNVKVLAMHGTMPDDPRYPFSQPRGYVYKGTPSPEVQAFLGFATSAPGQEIVQEAKKQEAASMAAPNASPGVVVSPEAIAPSAAASPEVAAVPAQAPATNVQTYKGAPWWLWWLSIPILGGLLWWLLRNRGGAVPVAPVAAPLTQTGRLILTPRNCRDAYAYWEIPQEQQREVQRQGGHKLMLRLYDVTDIDMDRQTPHSVKQFDCYESEPDLHVPIEVDDRDYVAELGYVTEEGRWLKLARSPHVHVPACEPGYSVGTAAPGATISHRAVNTALAGGAATTAAAGAAAASLVGRDRTATAGNGDHNGDVDPENRIILVPRNPKEAYAYWEVSDARKAELRRQGGQTLVLRIYDTTDLDIDYQSARGMQEYECSEQDRDRHVSIPVSDRDYLADLGYVTSDGRWLRLARSLHVHVPAEHAVR